MPGAFTHGNFDTWSPGYLMFLAALHNGISRLYETFRQRRARTPKSASCRPISIRAPGTGRIHPTQRFCGRSAITTIMKKPRCFPLFSISRNNAKLFLNNFYLKSKRSVDEAGRCRPCRLCAGAGRHYTNRQLQLLKVLALQHVEIQRLTQSRHRGAASAAA